MNIKKRVACSYLLKQYQNSLIYLKKGLERNIVELTEMDRLCDNVRNCGIAYAQAKYHTFSKRGILSEVVQNSFCKDGTMYLTSSYKEFLGMIESDIENIILNNQD